MIHFLLIIVLLLIIIVLLPIALRVTLPVLKEIAPFLIRAVGILALLAILGIAYGYYEDGREKARAERASFAARGLCKYETYVYNCADFSTVEAQRASIRKNNEELLARSGSSLGVAARRSLEEEIQRYSNQTHEPRGKLSIVPADVAPPPLW